MADVEGILLHKLLSNSDNYKYWPKLKPQYFSTEYIPLYRSISNFYNSKNAFPSFIDLEIISRDPRTINKLQALKLLEYPEDIDIELVIDAIINSFTQNLALEEISKFLDDIQFLDQQDIKLRISDIALNIEDQTHAGEGVFNMSDLILFDNEVLSARTPLGLNNTFDAATGGIAPSELILLGGYRGSGKSIVSTNATVNQYLQGNIGLYFSIEMPAHQVFQRIMAIAAGVPHYNIKINRLDREEEQRLAEFRAGMFLNSEEIYTKYFNRQITYEELELELIRVCKLKPENQIIIVYNPVLTLPDLDIQIKSAKSKYKDKLKVVVLDYLNQLYIQDMYDWKAQIEIAKELKKIAAKHDVAIVSPYQIDKTGEARFSKGILDAADIAVLLKPNKPENYIEFETTKIRDAGELVTKSPIDWSNLSNLRISANDYIPKEDIEKNENVKNQKTKNKAEDLW